MGYLDDTDIEWMVKQGKVEGVSAGSVQVREGVPINSLFIVLEGQFSVLVDALGSRLIASLHAGEIIGEISFVDSRPPTATVRASTAARVLAIPRDAICRRLEADSAFAARFYRAIAAFLADRMRNTVGSLGYGTLAPEAGDDELYDSHLDNVSMAASRMDRLIRAVQCPTRAVV
jgi:CRP-like cAMP-binding protein